MVTRTKFIILILATLVIAGALLIIRPWPEEPAKTAEQYKQEGKEYFSDQEWLKAKDNFEKAIELNPDDPTYYYHLGNALVKIGDYESAKKQFDTALSLNPNPLVENATYLGLGSAYFFTRDYEKAADLIEKSLSGEITCSETVNCQAKKEVIETTAYPLLGTTFYFLGDFAASEENFQKAIALELEDPLMEVKMKAKTYNSLGFLHLLLGNYEQALEYLDQSIASDEAVTSLGGPLSQVRFLPYLGKGIVLYSLYRYEEANDLLKQSLELHHLYPLLPQYAFYEAQIYNKLGKTAIDLGNFKEAENYLKEVLKAKEDNKFDTDFQSSYTQVDAYDGLGEIALNLKNYPEALAYFEKGLNEVPDKEFEIFQDKLWAGFMKILFHYRKAFTYSEMDNIPEAQKEIGTSTELVKSLSPDLYSIIEKIAWFKDGESTFQKVNALQNDLDR